MASLSIPFPDFTAGTTIVSSEVDQNNTAIVDYINARNSGSASWDVISTAGALTSTATTNQIALGTTNVTTITSPAPAANRTYTIPDAGGAASFVMTAGTQSIAGAKTFTTTGNAFTTSGVNLLTVSTSGNTGSDAAQLLLSVGGTSASDPYIQWTVSSGSSYVMGVDNSASDVLVISAGTAIGTSNIVQFASTEVNMRVDSYTERSAAGSNVISHVWNDDNTNAASHGELYLRTGGTSSGDPFIRFEVGGTTNWVIGCDNSTSDFFKINTGSTLGATNYWSIDTSNSILHEQGGVGSTCYLDMYASDNTSSSTATTIRLRVGGSNAGDPWINFLVQGVTNYSMGIDNSASDAFVLSLSNVLGTSNIFVIDASNYTIGRHLLPASQAGFNIGDASLYWADISYKTLTDRGCLPWCDEGVELADGRVVSDTEALLSIQKHATKKTVHGLPMLDYTTFPKKSYKLADKDGVLMDRDENGEPFWIDENGDKRPAADGVEMTMMFGVMIGAIKELTLRVKELEAKA